MAACSLIPRPLPLMRRNGLVNQVEFLGVAHTSATVTYLSRVTVIREVVLCNNYQSRNLIGALHFGE